MPTQVVWLRSINGYYPDPLIVSFTVKNTGDEDARSTRFTIDYNSADFQLVSPLSTIQSGNPGDVPHPASGKNPKSSAEWRIRALPRLTGDSVGICVSVSFDNHTTIDSCWKIWIPPMSPILTCGINAPEIKVDYQNLAYDQMPFTVTATVQNTGQAHTDSVFVTMILPSGLAFAEEDAPDNHTKPATPAILLPNRTGTVSWRITHPVVQEEKEYILEVWVKTWNADSSICQERIVIPAVTYPRLLSHMMAPCELFYIDSLDAYKPNPFEVSAYVQNVGSMRAEEVSAFIYIPDELKVVDGGKSKAVGDGIIEPSAADTVSWTLLYTARPSVWRIADIKIKVGGRTANPPDLPIDSGVVWWEIAIEPVTTDAYIPGDPGYGYELAQNIPNPFNPSTVIRYTIPGSEHVRLTVYDALGREVRTLVDERRPAGQHSVRFDAAGLPSGTYIYKLHTPHYTETRRMVLTR
ncbi:MAG: hypothetical protein CL946_04045 [Ectothiorhodospiraceae bacterium]|nr:hypothetical protein [Ectothiorhodospiraceae bacterium]